MDRETYLSELKKCDSGTEYFIVAKAYIESLENRRCSNCKHFIEFDSRVIRDSCNILNVSNIGGCGDYWEPKQ